MNDKYNDINFDSFVVEPQENITGREKRTIKYNFEKSTGKQLKQHISMKVIATIAACIVLCMVVTPLGNTVLAAIKDYLGIGSYMGIEIHDKYTTKINITKSIGDLNITLNEAIASDNEFRCVVTKENPMV